jgi:hypothetical protein
VLSSKSWPHARQPLARNQRRPSRILASSGITPLSLGENKSSGPSERDEKYPSFHVQFNQSFETHTEGTPRAVCSVCTTAEAMQRS